MAWWTASSHRAWSWWRSGSYRHQATRDQPNSSTNRQIRRLVLSVHPVSLSAVGAAQVRCQIQPDRLGPSGAGWWTATGTTATLGSKQPIPRRMLGVDRDG